MKLEHPVGKRILACIVVLVLVGGGAYGTYYWQHKKVTDLTVQASSLDKQIQSLKSQVATSNKTAADLRSTIAQMNAATSKSPVYAYDASIVDASNDKNITSILNVQLKLTNTSETNMTFNISDFTLVTQSGVVEQYGYNPNLVTSFPGNSLTLAPNGSATVTIPFSNTPKSSAKTLVIKPSEAATKQLAL